MLTTFLPSLDNKVKFKFEIETRISEIAIESCAAPVSWDYKRQNLKYL